MSGSGTGRRGRQWTRGCVREGYGSFELTIGFCECSGRYVRVCVGVAGVRLGREKVTMHATAAAKPTEPTGKTRWHDGEQSYEHKHGNSG